MTPKLFANKTFGRVFFVSILLRELTDKENLKNKHLLAESLRTAFTKEIYISSVILTSSHSALIDAKRCTLLERNVDT